MKKIAIVFVLCLFAQLISAQTRVITGTVTDAKDGSTLPGVSVKVKGTDQGAVTGMDGKYEVKAPAAAKKLVFSFIGMADQEVKIGASNVINVAMSASSENLDEIVVTAYGTKGKVGLKGSISVVGEKQLEQLPTPTFDQALQGKAAGLHIVRGSGQPGSSSTVRIRGVGSIKGGGAPLYVIDGVPIEDGDFSSFNANDFATVSVLKDAASTAIYGSRASNGVILITTKKGKAGKTTVKYNYMMGFADLPEPNFDMMNSKEKLAFEALAKKGKGWELSPSNPSNAGKSAAELAANAAELKRLQGINTDWVDVLSRRAKTETHDISITGGTDKTKVYMSYQYMKQEGFAIRSDLERHVGRFNIDHEINKKLKIGVQSTLANTQTNSIESEGGIFLSNPFAAMYLANPYNEPYDKDGNFITGSGLTGSNALERVHNSTDKKDQIKGVVSAYLSYEIIKGLTFKSQYGLDFRVNKYDRWVNPDSYAGSLVSKGNKGSMSNTYRRRSAYAFTNTLDYKKEFNDVHSISVVAGSEYLYKTYDGFSYTGYGLNPKLPKSPAGITDGTPDNNMIPTVGGFLGNERALFSIFTLGNYTYDNKYTLTASLRRDGSSAFGENNRYAVLWAAGLEWKAKEEEFLKDVEWIDDLKVRVSYGTTGNQAPIGDYAPLTTWGTNSYNGEQGVSISAAGDPDIKWEIGKKFNFGLSYTLFNERISGDIDIYNEVTSDLFISQKFSMTNTVNSKDVNAGEMRNRGIEFSINAEVLKINDFTWSVNGNIAYNENEILDLGQVSEFEQGTAIIKKGLPLGSHYAVKWAGVDPTTGAPLYYDKDGNITNKYGSYEVADFGTYIPPTTGGFGTTFAYKGLELNAHFIFAHGFKRFNNQTFFQENHNFAQFNLSTIMNEMWRKPGDITEVQSLNYARKFSSKDIEDASYLRLKTVRLSYTLPEKLVKLQKTISKVKFYAQAENLFTWTKFTGFDPEDSNNIATYEYPTPISYTFGVNVTF